MPWDKCSGYKSDKSAFIFSVDLCSKYPVNPSNSGYAICCDSKIGPAFGSYYFCICTNSNTLNSSYVDPSRKEYPNPLAANGKSALLDGEYNFLVADMEVYKVTVVA